MRAPVDLEDKKNNNKFCRGKWEALLETVISQTANRRARGSNILQETRISPLRKWGEDNPAAELQGTHYYTRGKWTVTLI